jgi:tRNAThr (cytosine32-N3)-methyltransferase
MELDRSESPLTPDESAAGPSTSARSALFGAASKHGRFLTPDQDPWAHNAWDNVEWDPDMQFAAESAVHEQRNAPVPQHLRGQSECVYDALMLISFFLNSQAQRKPGYILGRALQERARPPFQGSLVAHNRISRTRSRRASRGKLLPLAKCVLSANNASFVLAYTQTGSFRIAEIGCGPGNTVFPLLSLNENPDLFVHALDFSPEAISIAKVLVAWWFIYLFLSESMSRAEESQLFRKALSG